MRRSGRGRTTVDLLIINSRPSSIGEPGVRGDVIPVVSPVRRPFASASPWPRGTLALRAPTDQSRGQSLAIALGFNGDRMSVCSRVYGASMTTVARSTYYFSFCAKTQHEASCAVRYASAAAVSATAIAPAGVVLFGEIDSSSYECTQGYNT